MSIGFGFRSNRKSYFAQGNDHFYLFIYRKYYNIFKEVPERGRCFQDLFEIHNLQCRFTKQPCIFLIFQDLLQVKRTPVYHQSMQYAPIVVSLAKEEIRKHFGGNFLLQIYDKSGECRFSKVHQYETLNMDVYFDSIIFQLDQREAESKYIYIVKLNQESQLSTIKVKDTDDIFNNHFGLSGNFLYLANETQIRVIPLPEIDKKSKCVIPDKKCIKVLNIPKGQVFRGFFQNLQSQSEGILMCYLETEDNQISFNKIQVKLIDGVLEGIELAQYREVVRRSGCDGDNIIKFQQYINNEDMSFGCALRKSGKVDFYYDYQLTEETENYYNDIELNSQFLFLRYRQQEQTFATQAHYDDDADKILQISLKAKQRMGEDVGQIQKYKPKKWFSIKYDLIKYHVRIFTSLTLISTKLFVSFYNIVARYDVFQKEWTSIKFYEDDIVNLLRNYSSDEIDEQNVVAQLKNGQLKKVNRQSKSDGWNVEKQIKGKYINIVSDRRDMNSHFILTELPNGEKQLTLFQRNKICILNDMCKLQRNDELISCMTPNIYEDFALYNRDQNMIRTFVNKLDDNQQTEVTQLRNIKIKSGQELAGQIHSLVGTSNDEYLLAISKQQINKIQLDDGSVQTQSDYNIQSLLIIDNEYCYSLINNSQKHLTSGFYIQNVNAFIEQTKEATNFELEKTIVGHNNLMDYYSDDQRITYISSYEMVKIVPVLHRSVLAFIGMKPRHHYLIYTRTKDKLLALDKHGRVSGWSVTNGKLLEKRKCPNFNLKDYEVFKNGPDDITYYSEWYSLYVLLVNKNPVSNINEADFLSKRYNIDTNDYSSYLRQLEPKFYKFKVIDLTENGALIDYFNFIHPYYGDNKFQRMFFSDDLEYMIERQERNVFFYKKIGNRLGGQDVEWQLLRRIRQFPLDLSECTFVNYLFSPNLQLYLDFDVSDNLFVIKKSIDQTVFCVIPQGLMNPETDDIGLVGKKFQWKDNNVIRVINNEGIHKLVDIMDNCKQIAYCTMPMFDINYLRNVEKCHYFYDMSISKVNETLERLERKYQEYFQAYYIDGKTSSVDLYEILFKVDFNIDNCKGKVASDLSFSYFHWKIAELMQQNQNFNLKKFHPNEVKLLALSIFPKGNTVLHYAYKNINLVRTFYIVIEAEIEKEKKEAKQNGLEVIGFQIPFLKNFDQFTPLHLCLQNQSYTSADIIINRLCKDPIDSHSRSILDLLPQMIQSDLPSLGQYFDSRFTQTALLKEFKRGDIQMYNGLNYGITVSELWPDRNCIIKSIFQKSDIDTEVMLEFLDISCVHCYSQKIGDQFFEALAESKTIEIFEFRSIKALIDFKWPLAKEYTVKVLFVPFCVYLALFIIYSNVFNGQVPYYSEDPNDPGKLVRNEPLWIADKVISGLLYIFSIYFLQNELKDIASTGILKYFSSVWNYNDLIPPCLVITIVSLHLRHNSDESHEPELDIKGLIVIHSLASFLMWIKLLYFLRIFDRTGYLVRMLGDVVKDMKVFLLLLSIVIIAFGEAFMRLSEFSDQESQFHINYAYMFIYTLRLAIGDTDTATFNDTVMPALLWIYLTLCLVILNIVLLNLLIAIISESFLRINAISLLASYQEKSRIISENSYLIPTSRKNALSESNQYLLVARELAEVEEEVENEDVTEKIEKLTEDIKSIVNNLLNYLFIEK